MLSKGRINEAITAYQKTLSLNPKYAEATFNLGSTYKALGNIQKAIINSSDFDRLNKLRLNLRSQVISSPLFDSKRFSKVFEEAVWGMWSKW